MSKQKRPAGRIALGLLTVFAVALNLSGSVRGRATAAQESVAPPSSKLAGIAHIALRVHDLAASTAFYEKLGFVRAFALSRDSEVYEAFIKINDRQFIELYPATAKDPQVGFLHLCFEASQIQAVHDYYIGQGLKPIDVRKAGAGNLLFTMPGPTTPTGPQNIEYTQYMPGSLHSKDAGQHLGETRIAKEIASVTVGVLDPAAATAFYRQKLGFSATPGSGRRLVLPGVNRESVEIEPSQVLGNKSQLTLWTSSTQTAELLRQRGLAYTREGGTLVVLDPDGNRLVLNDGFRK